MTRISDITLTQQPECYTLTIRGTINFFNEYSDFVGKCFERIMAYLNSVDMLLSGEPIVCFHNIDLENLDVEVGFPVAKHINGKSDIKSNIIPTQKVVSAIDMGPYEQQDPTLEEIFSWIQKNDYEPQGDIYYQYLNNTERPASEYLTKMIVPIK